MPTYTYTCIPCDKTFTRMSKIDDRDKQYCECGHQLKRGLDRPGLVWAPTAGGYK